MFKFYKYIRPVLVFYLFITLFLVSFSLSYPIEAQAKFSALRFFKRKDKVLTEKQSKSLARKLAHKIATSDFFRSPDLPLRVVVAEMNVNLGAKSKVRSRVFTDQLVSELVFKSNVFVVNQELLVGTNDLQTHLTFYNDEHLTRKKGVLLGGDYVISGKLEEKVLLDHKGAYKTYQAKVYIKDVRSAEVMVEVEDSLRKVRIKKK